MDLQYQVGKVTHVIDPSNIWLQLSTVEFCELETDIQKCFHNEKPATQIGMVQPEQFVIAYSSSVEKWLRARISRVMGEKADLFYLDYGFAEQRPLNRISTEFPPRFSELNAQALHCRLYGIEPLAPPSWINRAGKVLSNVVSGQNFYVFFHCSSVGKYVVSLYNYQTQRSVIHELLESEVCKPDGEVPIAEYIASPSIPYNNDNRGFPADHFHAPKAYSKVADTCKSEDFDAVSNSRHPHTGIHIDDKNYWNQTRIPSADLSVFDATSELTPEKLANMDKMHQFQKAQQEVQNLFSHNADYMFASNSSLDCNYSNSKTLSEVMNDVQSQIQELYTDKKFQTENNNPRNLPSTRFDSTPISHPPARSQDIWTTKTRSVPPGFQPLGSTETSNNCPRRNFDDFTTWSPSFEPRQQPSLSPNYLKLVKPSTVLVPPSMFNSCSKTEPPKPNLPRNNWSTSWGSNCSHSVIDTNLTELAQKLQQVLPSAHSNVHWPQLYWEMDQLFLDFRELSSTQKLNLILKTVLTQAIQEPNFFNNAITLIFYFRDHNSFENSLRTTITDLEIDHIKPESLTAETFADLLGHIFVEICSRNSQRCSFTPFRTILTKWLNFSNPNNSPQSDCHLCNLYQHSFLDFWTVAGLSCLQNLSSEFTGFLRREMKSMILSTSVEFAVRSRLFSIFVEQEQMLYSQEQKSVQTVGVQTDIPTVPEKADIDPVQLSPDHNIPMYQQNGDTSAVDSWTQPNFSEPADIIDNVEPDYNSSQNAPLEHQFSALYSRDNPASPPLTPPLDSTRCCSTELLQSSEFPCAASPPRSASPEPEPEPEEENDSPPLNSDDLEVLPERVSHQEKYLSQRYSSDLELKRPSAMSLNLFEPYFLEKTLESASAPCPSPPQPPPQIEEEKELPNMVEEVEEKQANSELLRGSYAARVADSSGDGPNRNANSRTSNRNNPLFDYPDDHIAAIRNNARDIGNGKIRFVAKRLVPEKGTTVMNTSCNYELRGKKNGTFPSFSSTNATPLTSSCVSSQTSKGRASSSTKKTLSGNKPASNMSQEHMTKSVHLSSLRTNSESDTRTSTADVRYANTDAKAGSMHSQPEPSLKLNSRSVGRTQSCSQEIPCYQCTICGREGHQSHQCPNHSKYFFM
ncbi:uncharacterized protein LOC106867702 isoform X3 [Octopus bimaculoides]|uniref:CCHC-type domain-containing protein n=1 Tax=Octopus bimaculoides TaxID=37653 RepID=A0A0L8I099_OCTBM|nr:uncharacterized protein LOC106867702 isoform X3 [Octopus bimaculoides]|eukprot:XP_014768148.1 PREDICTED: uncharacterized protein LOC106867702 isoform X3 [Octopus bimaculoides]